MNDGVSVEDHPRDAEGRFMQVYAPGESIRDQRAQTTLSPHSRLREAEAKKEAILRAFMQNNGRKQKACNAAHVCGKTVDLWLETDPEFADAFFAIQANYVEDVEDRLDGESREGKGMPKVVATLAILNAENPQKYKRQGDRGPPSGELKVTVKLEPQSVPQWEKPQIEAGSGAG